MDNTFQLSFEQDLNFNYSYQSIDNLSEYEKYELSFHPERPKYLDYISIFDVCEFPLIFYNIININEYKKIYLKKIEINTYKK